MGIVRVTITPYRSEEEIQEVPMNLHLKLHLGSVCLDPQPLDTEPHDSVSALHIKISKNLLLSIC